MHPYVAQVVQEERTARMREEAHHARRGLQPRSARGSGRLEWIRDHVGGIAARAAWWRAPLPLDRGTRRVD
jgi:hypothetical protein